MRLKPIFPVLLSVLLPVMLSGCAPRSVQSGPRAASPLVLQADPVMPDLSAFPRKELPSGLIYEVVQPGSGAAPEPGEKIRIHYSAWLASGKMFDSSRQRNEPFVYSFATGQVIPGFDEGVRGMLPGERRILIIPPHLGYGANGMPPMIPPDATLVFDIEYLGSRL